MSKAGRDKTGKLEIIELKSKPVMDIRVHYAGDEFARWSLQQPTNQNLNRLELKPGESRTIEMTWVPDNRAYGLPVNIQGLLSWSEDRTTYAPVILPVDYLLVR